MSKKEDSKKKAQKNVESYVIHPECFITFMNNKDGYKPISGTPCAHYVAHKLDLKGGSFKCEKGYYVRVKDLLKVLTVIPTSSVKVGDVWAWLAGEDSHAPYDHCGIVSEVIESGKSRNFKIKHNTSRVKTGPAENEWKSWFHGEGKFYSTTGNVAPPQAQLNVMRLKHGIA